MERESLSLGDKVSPINKAPKRKLKRAFLLMEILISLGLFASVAGAASVPYYKLKQTLQKEWLELEAYRYSLLARVIEQDPGTVNQKWPYWESVGSYERFKDETLEGSSWGVFEEKSMKLWKIDSSSRVVEQMPKRPNPQQPSWRKYILVQHLVYYRDALVVQYDYGYSLFSVKKSSEVLDSQEEPSL